MSLGLVSVPYDWSFGGGEDDRYYLCYRYCDMKGSTPANLHQTLGTRHVNVSVEMGTVVITDSWG
jgi:hypothetical protein